MKPLHRFEGSRGLLCSFCAFFTQLGWEANNPRLATSNLPSHELLCRFIRAAIRERDWVTSLEPQKQDIPSFYKMRTAFPCQNNQGSVPPAWNQRRSRRCSILAGAVYSAQTYVWKRLFQTGFGRSPKPAPAEIKVWQSLDVSQRQLLQKHGVQGQIAKECAHDQCPFCFHQASCLSPWADSPHS